MEYEKAVAFAAPCVILLNDDSIRLRPFRSFLSVVACVIWAIHDRIIWISNVPEPSEQGYHLLHCNVE